MFNRIGIKIQSIAKALFAVYVLFGFVISLTATILLGEQGIFVFFIGMGITVFSAYISVMLIYAIGSITDDLNVLRAKICGDVNFATEEKITKSVPLREETDKEYINLLEQFGSKTDDELEYILNNSHKKIEKAAAQEVIEVRTLLD